MAKPAKTYIPDQMSPVTPHLVCAGAAKAIDFYAEAFGAEEMHRVPGPDGKLMHACVRIAGAPVFLVDENPDYRTLGPDKQRGSPVLIHLFVPNVDAFYERAIKAGATAVMPPTDMFWGDRYGQVTDPFGHHWSIATHKQVLTDDEIQQGMKAMMDEHQANYGCKSA